MAKTAATAAIINAKKIWLSQENSRLSEDEADEDNP